MTITPKRGGISVRIPTTLRGVKMSAESIEKNPDLCAKEWVNALRALPAGFYTVVVRCADGDAIEDVRVGARGALSVRSYDGKAINDPQRQPCLRVEVVR